MQRLFKRTVIATLGLLLATVAVAQDRPKVVTVNYPLQYFAERLLGDTADVEFPVPEDVDPSFWRPSIADISMIQSADLILLNGASFATWVDRVTLPRSRLVNTSAALKDQFIVTESITHSHGDGGEHSHEGVASYLWLDPTLAIAQAEAIAEAITARELASADDVAIRLEELRADLEAMDQTAQSAFSDTRDVALIATHPRYQYLARRYGLSITSVEWDAGAAPTPEQLTELSSIAERTGAQVLIWEAEPPATAIEALRGLGMESVIFPTLAHKPSAGTYLDSYQKAVSDLSQASLGANN
ncbi:metal ABC transporter substrate-binding protein [Ruegeria profundi]|uniref:metal ABC transporter substrate-binding protein n=1 Tax=Ruegeria profundi TaxID=1685378 RepID=UPI001CD3C975|nr:metal ABC transporter substrate-binding protein [Ruegeria profundi]MCA0928438.1 metal ABC transporter substrate-binding protein [Ruegeria profundi]